MAVGIVTFMCIQSSRRSNAEIDAEIEKDNVSKSGQVEVQQLLIINQCQQASL